jgi:hypothetical protein
MLIANSFTNEAYFEVRIYQIYFDFLIRFGSCRKSRTQTITLSISSTGPLLMIEILKLEALSRKVLMFVY